jgi:hypothetical protein
VSAADDFAIYIVAQLVAFLAWRGWKHRAARQAAERAAARAAAKQAQP